MIRQTGGSAVAETSTRSRPAICAACRAAGTVRIPNCSPASEITRTSLQLIWLLILTRTSVPLLTGLARPLIRPPHAVDLLRTTIRLPMEAPIVYPPSDRRHRLFPLHSAEIGIFPSTFIMSTNSATDIAGKFFPSRNRTVTVCSSTSLSPIITIKGIFSICACRIL